MRNPGSVRRNGADRTDRYGQNGACGVITARLAMMDLPSVAEFRAAARGDGDGRAARALHPILPQRCTCSSVSAWATSSGWQSDRSPCRRATSKCCSRARSTRCAPAPARSWARRPRTRRSRPGAKRELYELYLRRHDRIDNWDLVDLAAHQVVGTWLLDKPVTHPDRLARSSFWPERRTAIVATAAFIKRRDTV